MAHLPHDPQLPDPHGKFSWRALETRDEDWLQYTVMPCSPHHYLQLHPILYLIFPRFLGYSGTSKRVHTRIHTLP